MIGVIAFCGSFLATSPALASELSDSQAAAVSVRDLEDAKYDEQRLKKLVELCNRGTCSQDLSAVIQSRLETISRERQQFNAAQTEADYQAYLSKCVACSYRDQTEQLLHNLKSAVATPAPAPSPTARLSEPSSSTSPEIAAEPQSWHTVAHALYRVRGHARVAIGYSGPQPSPLEAERAARQECERTADGRECDTSRASSTGCFYITVGTSRHGVTWMSGDSKQGTYNRCRNDGYSCHTPIGGCLDE